MMEVHSTRKLKIIASLLFLKDKVHSQHQTCKTHKVVPLQPLVHEYHHKEREDHKRHHLLNNLQVPQRKWASHSLAADAVGRYLEAVLEECYRPANEDDSDDAIALQPRLKGDVSIPSQGHKDIGAYK